jgi:bisphosphoglycerate-independent phosphoglycerate mutase (AlkP superfamily)
MYTYFAKKSFLLKVINCIALINFIFTGIPVKSYAGVSDSDDLRKLSARKDGSAEKIQDELAEKEIRLVLENRNKARLSNFPADIRRENEELFNTLKELRIPIYSKQDQVVYVWDADGLEQALQEQYAQGKNDEAMISIVTIGQDGFPKSRLAKGKAIVDINYRKDRQKQWIAALLANTGFKEFAVPEQAKDVTVFGMTRYTPELSPERVIFEDTTIVNGLPEVLFKNGIKTVYVFDAEKSEFIPAFRGGNEQPFPNEDLEFSSISMPVLMTFEQVNNFKPPVVAKLEGEQYIAWFYGKVPGGLKQIPNNEYWRYVGLSMFPVAESTAKKIRAAQAGTFGLTNLSGPDLNGHVSIKNLDKLGKLFIQRKDGTFEIKEGNGWDSVKECLKVADTSVQMIMQALEEKEGVLVLVGDHGSVDDMTQPNHSFNDVPIFIIDFKHKDLKLVRAKDGLKDTQADVAATISHIFGIDKPKEMTGKSLLPPEYAGSKDRVVWQIILDGFGHTDFNDPQNAFGVAMKAGLMPTVKSLYDKGNYGILKAGSWYAGLRGGRQEDFKEGEITKTRDTMIEEIKKLSPEKIKITYYDYRDVNGAINVYTYEKGLFELQHSPFLNDKEFVIKFDDKNRQVDVLCLDYRQMGSTEYNTWTLGAGRIVWQSVVLIDNLFISNAISANQALKAYSEIAKAQGEAHFAGILQEAAVHASVRHLYYLLQYLKNQGVKRFTFDLASDGRDEGKKDSLLRIRQLRAALNYLGITDYDINIRGREICFDRAKNWRLTEAWVNELFYGSRFSPDERNAAAGLGVETTELKDFLDGNRRIFRMLGGETVLRAYLKKVNDEISKLRGSITDHKVALVVDASFLRKGGALDALRAVLQLKPFVKLGIYGKGSDRLAALFSGDKDVITTATLDEMVATLSNRGGVARGKDIVVLRPSETLDPDWQALTQIGFSKKGISTVDVAKAMGTLVDTPGNKEAFKKFYGELENQKIISSASYTATKDKVFTEVKEGAFDLPEIEPVQKISETIAKESDSVSKFVDTYI